LIAPKSSLYARLTPASLNRITLYRAFRLWFLSRR
jgi:hypothetical protein